MNTELIEAAKEMLAAVDGMYIEFVDRAEIVDKAERRLRAALTPAPVDESENVIKDAIDEIGRGFRGSLRCKIALGEEIHYKGVERPFNDAEKAYLDEWQEEDRRHVSEGMEWSLYFYNHPDHPRYEEIMARFKEIPDASKT